MDRKKVRKMERMKVGCMVERVDECMAGSVDRLIERMEGLKEGRKDSWMVEYMDFHYSYSLKTFRKKTKPCILFT